MLKAKRIVAATVGVIRADLVTGPFGEGNPGRVSSAGSGELVQRVVFIILAASLSSVVGCGDGNPTGLAPTPLEVAYIDVSDAADALSAELAELTWTERGEHGVGGAVFLISDVRAWDAFIPSLGEPDEGTYFAYLRRLEVERARLERLRGGASSQLEPVLSTLATNLEVLRTRVIQDVAPGVSPLVESGEEVREPFEMGITLTAFGGDPPRTAETFPIAVVGTVQISGGCYDDQGQSVLGVTLRVFDAVDRSVLAIGEPSTTLGLDEPTRVILGVEGDAATAAVLNACELSLGATRPALSATPLTSQQDGTLQQRVQDYRAFLDAKRDTVRLRISGADDQTSRDLYAELGARLEGSERLLDMLFLVSVLGEMSPDEKEIARKEQEMTEDELDELIEEMKKDIDDAREQKEEIQRILLEIAQQQSEVTRTITSD